MTEIPGPEDRADDATVEAPATPDTTTEPADTTADTTELPTPGAPIEPTPTTPPPTGGGRKGVFVPLWSLLVVGGLVLFGIGFLAGHAVADEDHDDHFARDHRSEQERPDLPGGRTAPFGNGGNQAPDAAPGQGPRQVPGPQTGQGAFLGVAVTNGTDPAGAELLRVVAGSPADDAGLERGDVITEFDGKEIDDAAALSAAVGEQKAGASVEISYSREGDVRTVTVKLGDRSDAPDPGSVGPQ